MTVKYSVKTILFLTLFFISYSSSNSQSYFSDNFESGLSNWLVSGQDWDTTSIFYRDGGHSITESPNGNYKPGAHVTILLVKPVNIENSIFPVLSFWHRFNTEYSNEQGIDFCRVEISKNSGFTWKEIKKYSGNQNSWTYEQLDLRKYKSDEFKIRFILTDSYANWNGNNQQDGWYIDDVEIKELEKGPSISFPFKDDFENGLNNWLLSTKDWNTTSKFVHSGNLSITDSPDGNYPTNANSTLTLAGIIDLTISTSPVLTFWQRYNTNGDMDFCHVEISTDYGFTWNEIKKFSGVQNTWLQETIDLSNYKNNAVKIRFRLLGTHMATEDGWYIDDVEIKENHS
jgi:hypothetical protein